jgi:hypothetical protein
MKKVKIKIRSNVKAGIYLLYGIQPIIPVPMPKR